MQKITKKKDLPIKEIFLPLKLSYRQRSQGQSLTCPFDRQNLDKDRVNNHFSCISVFPLT